MKKLFQALFVTQIFLISSAMGFAAQLSYDEKKIFEELKEIVDDESANSETKIDDMKSLFAQTTERLEAQRDLHWQDCLRKGDIYKKWLIVGEVILFNIVEKLADAKAAGDEFESISFRYDGQAIGTLELRQPRNRRLDSLCKSLLEITDLRSKLIPQPESTDSSLLKYYFAIAYYITCAQINLHEVQGMKGIGSDTLFWGNQLSNLEAYINKSFETLEAHSLKSVQMKRLLRIIHLEEKTEAEKPVIDPNLNKNPAASDCSVS